MIECIRLIISEVGTRERGGGGGGTSRRAGVPQNQFLKFRPVAGAAPVDCGLRCWVFLFFLHPPLRKAGILWCDALELGV